MRKLITILAIFLCMLCYSVCGKVISWTNNDLWGDFTPLDFDRNGIPELSFGHTTYISKDTHWEIVHTEGTQFLHIIPDRIRLLDEFEIINGEPDLGYWIECYGQTVSQSIWDYGATVFIFQPPDLQSQPLQWVEAFVAFRFLVRENYHYGYLHFEYPRELDPESLGSLIDGGRVKVLSINYESVPEQGITSYGITEDKEWGGFEISDDGVHINTGDWLGWINIKYKPYVYVYRLQKYLYMEEPNIFSGGEWLWIIP